MENVEKQGVVEMLKVFIEKAGSQNKAAKMLGTSSATLSKMRSGDWALITDDMWRSVGAGVAPVSSGGWVAVETDNYRELCELFGDAQGNSSVMAITGEAGSGKTFTARAYREQNSRVYLLSCNEFWNRKMFLSELCSALGRDSSGYTVGEMMANVITELRRVDRPLIILDEADKLSDQVMYFFITLYNQLEDKCGIVMCATDHLSKRIERGIKLNKKGYKEIYSRIARRFIELDGVSGEDVVAVCVQNGITDKAEIKEVMNDCDWDLRRVKRKVHALKQSKTLV